VFFMKRGLAQKPPPRSQDYALTAPAVISATIFLLKYIKRTSGGNEMSNIFMNNRFHWVRYWLLKLKSVSCTVGFVLDGKKYKGVTKSLNMAIADMTINVDEMGCNNGKIILKYSFNPFAPSIIAASSNSLGIVAINALYRRTQNARFNAVSNSITLVIVLNKPIP